MELEKFIAIEKKSSASQAMKKEFFVEMEKYLTEHGFSKEAERFQFLGLPFCGMKPTYAWLIAADEEVRYKSIKNSKTMTQNERGITFKVMLSLLSCFLNDKSESALIVSIIDLIGYYSKNKEGKYFGDMRTSFENYFLAELKDGIEYPELKLTTPSARNFLIAMSAALSEVTGTKTITQDKLDKLKAWLSSLMPDGKLTGATINTQNMSNKEKTKSQILHELADFLAKLENDKENIAVQLSALRNENSRLSSELEFAKKNNDELRHANEQLFSVKEDLREKLSVAEARIKSLEEESQKQSAVLNIFEADKKNSQQGQLNAIASRLRTEYEDFKSIISEEMTVGLGENLRKQLINIFKILEKNGITIEKR